MVRGVLGGTRAMRAACYSAQVQSGSAPSVRKKTERSWFFGWPPLTTVIVLSIAFGIIQGLTVIAWHDAIEHGQVLAGTVAYPPGHPIGMYYLKAYSLADHLSALWLAAGLSQAWLACVLQVLKGAVFYAGLALCTFALTSRVGCSLLSPMVWSAFQLGRFSDAYPITPIDHPNTNGFLGAAVLLLALGLVATHRRFAGGLAMGVLPYVHVAFGVFGWLAGCLWCLVDRPTRRQIIGFCSGAAIFAVSFGWHQLHFARPSVVSAGLADYYFLFYTEIFDYHRQALHPTSVHTFLLFVIGTLALLYVRLAMRASAKCEGSGIVPLAALLAIAAALGYSAIAGLWGLGAIPHTVLLMIPGRLGNVAVLLSGPLLFGLAAYLPSQTAGYFAAVLTASAFVPRAMARFGSGLPVIEDPAVNTLIWFLALACVLLVAPYGQPSRPGWLRMGSAMTLVGVAFVGIHRFAPTTWFGRPLTLGAWQFLMLVLLAGAFWMPMHFAAAQRLLKMVNGRWPWVSLTGTAMALVGLSALNAGLLTRTAGFTFLKPPAPENYRGIPPGELIPSPDYHLVQLESQHPVVWFPDVRTGIPYAPEAGPALERMLTDIYGWHGLYDPPLLRFGAAAWENITNVEGTWAEDLRPVWENRSEAEWQRIATLYGARMVLVPCDYKMRIPQIQRVGGKCVYALPEPSATAAPDSLQAAADTSTVRFFLAPQPAWRRQGWRPPADDSAVTPDSGWLDQRGEMVVYVPRAGDYRLHAEIAPVGEQRLRIVPRDSATAGPVYRLTGNQSPGFSEFQSAPVHLKAGVNFVDLLCEGAAGEIGGGRRASIGFKEMRWETAGEGN